MASIGRFDFVIGMTNQFSEGFRKLDAELKRSTRSIDRLGKKWQDVGKSLTLGLSVPIAGLGVAASRSASTFDDELNKINALVGVSKEQIAIWREQILKIAPAVGKGPKELAEGLFFVASAGARGDAAIRALVSSSQASAAGLGEVRVIANAATSAIAAYGEANLSSAKATGLLIASAREGKFETSAFAGGLGDVIPTAQALGISFDQVGASIASLSRINGDARKSITGLRGVLSKIIKPSQQGKKQLEEIGLTSDRLRQSIRDRGLIDVLIDLRKEFDKNSEAAGRFFEDEEGLLAFLSLTGENAKQNIEIFRSLAKSGAGDLKKAFDSLAETTGFKFLQAQSLINTSFIRLGDAILPHVVPILARVVSFVERASIAFGNLSPEVKKSIVQFAAITALAGPAIFVTGGIVRAFASATAAIRVFAVASVASFKFFRKALVAIVVRPVAFSVGALVLTFGGIPVAAGAAIAATVAAFIVFRDTITGLAEGIKAILFATLVAGFNNNIARPFIENINSLINAIPERFRFGLEPVEVPLEIDFDTGEAFGQIFKDAVSNARREGDQLKSQITSVINGIKDRAKSLLPEGLIDVILGGEDGDGIQQTLDGYFENLTKQLENFKDVAASVGDEVGKSAKEAARASERAFSSLEDDLTRSIANGKLNFKSFIDTVINEFIRLQVVRPLLEFFGTDSGSFSSLFGSFFGKAGGGRIAAGQPTLVGERGPELIVPSRTGTVLNNADSRRVLSGGGGVTIIQHISPNFAGNAATREDVMQMAKITERASVNAVLGVLSRRKFA